MIKEKLMINCQVNFQLGYFLKNGETKILPWLLSLSWDVFEHILTNCKVTDLSNALALCSRSWVQILMTLHKRTAPRPWSLLSEVTSRNQSLSFLTGMATSQDGLGCEQNPSKSRMTEPAKTPPEPSLRQPAEGALLPSQQFHTDFPLRLIYPKLKSGDSLKQILGENLHNVACFQRRQVVFIT